MRRRPRRTRRTCCAACATICWRSGRSGRQPRTPPRPRQPSGKRRQRRAARHSHRHGSGCGKQADAYAPLRALLLAQQPDASLTVFSTRAPKDGVFVSLQAAMVVSAAQVWDENVVRQALTQALLPGLTTGKARRQLGKAFERRRDVSCAGWRRASVRRGERQATAAGQRFCFDGKAAGAPPEASSGWGKRQRDLCGPLPALSGAGQLPPADGATGPGRSSRHRADQATTTAARLRHFSPAMRPVSAAPSPGWSRSASKRRISAPR
jgi:hypothetical protein